VQRQTPAGFGIQMTKLTKTVLIVLFGLYVLQAVTGSIVPWGALRWSASASDAFHPWQPFTHWLIVEPSDVLGTFLSWLMVVFFLPPTEESYGTRGVLRITIVIVAVCAIVGTIGVLLGGLHAGVAMGLMPLITAFITLFGLNRPNATILLFFVLPIKAIWIAWGTGLISLMYFLASIPEGGSLPASLSLTAWATAYAWVQLHDRGGLRKLILRKKQRQLQRRLRRFEVHEGGGENSTPRGWGHDPNQGDDDPIVH
jgi:hypothetical protein